ncbi:unnamed protein product [Candida verbasci]|uniref:Uncharacterized protein n=1 Tax=Candida verbasci TaxID=1227364 RepID=A0A9W4XNP1_9ASCO|nr:unnamed protein product [Candida verbasci]
MSSTPSSPSKRSILSPKPSNINTSPIKRPSSSILLKSPPKKFHFKLSPSPKKKTKTVGFTIWEDKIDVSNSTHEIIGTNTTNELNHNDQENILQKHQIKRNGNRTVLGDLDINEFKGFITCNGRCESLTDLYQPINFNNEFKSLHKYTNLPNYCTPIRKDKYIMKSNNGFNEEDEMETLLIKKQQILTNQNKTNLIRKHKRSMSVGKNEAKLNLIRKNKFSILSN